MDILDFIFEGLTLAPEFIAICRLVFIVWIFGYVTDIINLLKGASRSCR